METFQLLVGYAIPLAFFALLIVIAVWTAEDAEKRGKSPLLVCVFVIVTFPCGLLAWLIFRPSEVPAEPSRLQDYRS